MERCVLLARLGLVNLQSYDFQMPYYRGLMGFDVAAGHTHYFSGIDRAVFFE
jgi:hypothetical protein